MGYRASSECSPSGFRGAVALKCYGKSPDQSSDMLDTQCGLEDNGDMNGNMLMRVVSEIRNTKNRAAEPWSMKRERGRTLVRHRHVLVDLTMVRWLELQPKEAGPVPGLDAHA